MKEGGANDNLAIAWQYPGQSREVIPARFSLVENVKEQVLPTTLPSKMPTAKKTTTPMTKKPTKKPSRPPTGRPMAGSTFGDWEFCSSSSQCRNGCCNSRYSDDSKLKCTPVGGFKPHEGCI
jgi:hypothetical protein